MPRRSSKKTSARSRPKVDWVVNDLSYGSAYNLPNGAQMLIPLTVPKFAVSYTDPLFAGQVEAYILPEQANGQVAYAVKGHYSLFPSAWAVGTVYRIISRIVKKPVEYATQFDAIVDQAYSLFDAEFANERFLWQRYHRQDFALGSAGEVTNVSWSGTCKLEPDEGLYLAFENQSGITQSLNIQPFLRTLMRADG